MIPTTREAATGLGRDYAGTAAELQRRYNSARNEDSGVRPFALTMPDCTTRMIGDGVPQFTLSATNEQGARAIASFDELTIAEAYMNSHIDIEGDMLQALRYRRILGDRRPLYYLYSTYIQPLLFGQVRSDKKWVSQHYDADPEFFTMWLDTKIRGYSHGFFENDAEPLEAAMERKFRYAMDACHIRPGQRVLDIGGGWGSFLEFAGDQGVRVTSVTISDASEKFMKELIARKNLPCEVINRHFLDYRSEEPFDAIVNLGVSEHLPDYKAVLQNYKRLLKPGGRIYLDAYSGERFKMPSFILRWVYPGNTSPLNLPLYTAELERAGVEVLLVENDRHNYFLTCKKWAENLESVRDVVVARWGQHLYRRFRLYLWSAARSFEKGDLCAHRMILQIPGNTHGSQG